MREVYASVAATASATSAARTWAFRAKSSGAAVRHREQRPHVHLEVVSESDEATLASARAAAEISLTT